MSLTVSHIAKDYITRSGLLPVLRDCSFELHVGQSLSIVGPSGSGKSTLLSILGTLEPATSGSVILGGVDLQTLPAKELPALRRHKIGFVFQEHHLLPQCGVMENVLMPLLAEGRISEEQKGRAMELLKRVGLEQRLNHRPAELSGGERQRVAIARSLIFGPTLILADEPTGSLDRSTAAVVGDLLLELAGDTMLVLATHDQTLAAGTSRQCEMDGGELKFDE